MAEPERAFRLDRQAAQRVIETAQLEPTSGSYDLRALASRLIKVVLGGNPRDARRMNHAQLISCVAYVAFVAGDFDSLERPRGYDYPKSVLCFASAWWEDAHLGVAVTVAPEENPDLRHTTASPLIATELFPHGGVQADRFEPALQGMFEGLVAAANRTIASAD